MKIILVVAGLILMTCVTAFGSPPSKVTPFESNGDGPLFHIDYANFQGSGDLTYLEFYIEVGYGALQFYKEGKEFHAGYELEIALLDKEEVVIQKHTTHDDVQVPDFEETVRSGRARASLVGWMLEPGEYILKAHMTDTETRRTSRITEYVTVRDLQTPGLLVSDIQFSQKIETADSGPYVKNGRYIQPTAMRVFAHAMLDIYLYFEIYNLITEGQTDYTNYMAHFIFHNEEGRIVGHIKRPHPKPGASSAHSIKLPADHFTNGEYALTVKVVDQDTQASAESTSSFRVLDFPVSMTDTDYEAYTN